jgi:hypothetical protein
VTTQEQGCKRSKQSVSDLNMPPQLPLVALTFAALLVSSTDWGVVANELDLDDVDSTTTVRFACWHCAFASSHLAQATGFVPLHSVRVLFPTPDHVYKGPQLHFEVKKLHISHEQVPCVLSNQYRAGHQRCAFRPRIRS